MHIDIEESDPDKGMTFREGAEVNIENYDLKEEVEKWNAKYLDHQLSYDAIMDCIKECIPLYGVVDGQRKIKMAYIPHKVSKENSDYEIV